MLGLCKDETGGTEQSQDNLQGHSLEAWQSRTLEADKRDPEKIRALVKLNVI